MCKFRKRTIYTGLLTVLSIMSLTGCNVLSNNKVEKATTEATVTSSINVSDEELLISPDQMPVSDEEITNYLSLTNIYTVNDFAIMTFHNDTDDTDLYIYTQKIDLANYLFTANQIYKYMPVYSKEVDNNISIAFANSLNKDNTNTTESDTQEVEDTTETSVEDETTQEEASTEEDVSDDIPFDKPIYILDSINVLDLATNMPKTDITDISQLITIPETTGEHPQPQGNTGTINVNEVSTITDEEGRSFVVPNENTTETTKEGETNESTEE